MMAGPVAPFPARLPFSPIFQILLLQFVMEILPMRTCISFLSICAFTAAAIAAEKRLEMKDLPAAVQKTITEQTKGAEIKGLAKEMEKGKVSYEVETIVNGKHRDFIVDPSGALGEVEEEAALGTIPPAAKAAIEKKASGGKLGMVEIMKRGGETLYEAAYTAKDGKKHSILVNADGTPVKD